MDFLTIDVGTILYTLLNTLLIFLAFRFILFKRVDAIVEQRRLEVEATYHAADDDRAAAASERDKYTELMAGAREESAQIISRAQKSAQREGDAIMENARLEAQAAREKAQQDIAREMVQAKGELKGEISDLAMELARKIMEKEISKDDHERLIDDFLEKMGDEA